MVVSSRSRCPSNIWMVRRSAPASSRCVAKQCLSVCGCTSFWRPACWAAFLQASQTTLVVIGVSPVCQRLPGNSHALAIDVIDFQVCQFSASYTGGVERHQQSAMIRSQSCVDESRDFFPAEDRRKVKCSFRIGRLGDAPGFLESFDVEESQSCQSLRNRGRRQLALLEQLGLIFTNVFGTQTIWRTLESS